MKQKVSYYKQPEDLSLEEWQITLRKQFVIGRTFKIDKIDGFHPVFGDYWVGNIENKNSYKVSIRDYHHPHHYCSCLDFKTNHLGTCKHIEAVLLKIDESPKLREHTPKVYEPAYTSVFLSYRSERKVRIRIGSDQAEEFKRLAEYYFDNDLILKPHAFSHFESFLEQAYALDPDFRCYNDALSFVLEVRDRNNRKAYLEQRYPGENDLQDLLKTRFFPYQHKGVLFAAKAGRCLIADEMGLGKTIQAIGVAELLKKERNISKVLIICPTSLKYQWESEINRFTESSVKVIEGLKHKREIQYLGEEFYKVVSYHTVLHDTGAINEADFDLVILDEAQRIKNWKTKIASAVKKIQSTYCVVLTGTPLENKLEELYSIVQFIDPFCLGAYHQFMHRYQVTNETGKVVGYQHLNEIGEILRDIVLRRTKKEVLSQLPERMDKTLFVPMTEKQMELHEEYQYVVSRLVSKWQRLGFLNEKDRQNLMIHLNMMRMVCDSSYIIDQKTRHDTKIAELMNILEQSSEKVVIFSQWERMTRLVAQELDALGVKYESLHGGIPSKDRKALFDNFNTDPECRIFLSTDAGSTGLNLQSASMLINLDIPWNPAVLEQRIARIHRLGQKSNVSIINFVSKDTIEERMLGVLCFKSELAKGILDMGEDAIFMQDDKFKKFMQSVQDITESTDSKEPASLSEEEEMESAEMQTDTEETPNIIQAIQNEIPFEEEESAFFEEPDSVKESEPVSSELNSTELLSQGLSFLSSLSKTLASPEKTAELVNSITEKDTNTGQTYLKIPIESQEIVSSVLSLMNKLLK